jgi:ribosome-binding factor A
MKHERDPAAAHRHQRLESSILEELRFIARDELEDPALDGVRLTAVVLSPDGRTARIHYAIPKDRDRMEVDRAFARAGSFLRRRLAEGVELKRTPELRFVFEAQIESD